MPAEDLRTATQRLLTQIGHWESARWATLPTAATNTAAPAAATPATSAAPGAAAPAGATSAAPGAAAPAAAPAAAGTRGDLVYGLVQRLADLGADAERRPRREVPREADTALPDQLRVMTDDLLLAAPAEDLLIQATADLLAVRKAL